MTDATDTTERDRKVREFLEALKRCESLPTMTLRLEEEVAALTLWNNALHVASILHALPALLALADGADKIVDVLRAAACPNCDGSGAKVVPGGFHGLVSREMAIDAGDPDMEGMPYGESEPQLEQCQWCAERNDIADLAEAAQAALKGSDE